MVENTLTPPVTWAQRAGVVFMTINVQDCKSPEITIDSNKVHFKAVAGVDKKLYELTVELCKEVIPDGSKYHVGDRAIEFLLRKKEEGPFWPSLLKSRTKQHWLKVDFNKWKDEDDTDDEGGYGGQDFEQMLKQMGGLGGEGDKPSLDDLDDGGDSDDENMPDLE